MTSAELSDRPQRVAWSEIESVAGKNTHFSRSHTVEGMVVGGLVGLAVSGLLVAAKGRDHAVVVSITRSESSGRRRRLPPVSYAGMLLAAAGLFLAAAGAAHASPVPDSTRIATLRAACASWNRVRIQSSRGIFTFGSPKFDSIGLVLRVPPRRPALIMDRPVADAEPERVRWSDIQRIDGTHSHAGRGFAEGAVAGGIVGLSAALLSISNSTSEDFGAVGVGMVPLGILLGGVIGAGLGSSSRWTALYP